MLRDCPAMVGLWIRLVPERERQGFFTSSLLEWLFDNLNPTAHMRDTKWATVFAMRHGGLGSGGVKMC